MERLYPDCDPLEVEFGLSDAERAVLWRLRRFLEDEAKPVLNEHWEAGEFPYGLVDSIVRLGLMEPEEFGGAPASLL